MARRMSSGIRFGRPLGSTRATVTLALKIVSPSRPIRWSISSRAPPISMNRVSTTSMSSMPAGFRKSQAIRLTTKPSLSFELAVVDAEESQASDRARSQNLR